MAALDLDPRFQFESFVVGGGNRLARAAAKRVAESPGASYNPLFIYSASGLGKTHLITAIGHQARRLHPDLPIVYDTLEHFMDDVAAAIEAGERDIFGGRFPEAALLLLDDVQFLAGRHRTREELLRSWDALFAQGGGVVLTSDRPPAEIERLDDRLLSRFSGGLIVDIAAPDYETRVAIIRRKAREREQELADGVEEALAHTEFSNVRELQGALNRLIAVQELEGRAVSPDEVPALVGTAEPADHDNEFDDFLAGVRGAVEEAVSLPAPPPGGGLDALELPDAGFALRAASAIVERPGEQYNPLLVHGAAPSDRSAFLAALGREIAISHPERPLAYLEGPRLVAELIDAIGEGRVESWRERYRRASVFLLDEVDALAGTERAQQELFHLFNALEREGAQLAFTASAPPAELDGLDERLRTRLASGLVVDLSRAESDEPAETELDAAAGTAVEPSLAGSPSPESRNGSAELFRDRERIVWEWPYPADCLYEELD